MGLYGGGDAAPRGVPREARGPFDEGKQSVRIQIAAHHVELTESLRDLIQERSEHLMRFFDGVSTIHVMVGAEKARRVAEFVAHVSHGADVVAKAEAETLESAVHDAAEKMETQLRRHKDRIRDRRDRDEDTQALAADETPDEADGWEPPEDEIADGDEPSEGSDAEPAR